MKSLWLEGGNFDVSPYCRSCFVHVVYSKTLIHRSLCAILRLGENMGLSIYVPRVNMSECSRPVHVVLHVRTATRCARCQVTTFADDSPARRPQTTRRRHPALAEKLRVARLLWAVDRGVVMSPGKVRKLDHYILL